MDYDENPMAQTESHSITCRLKAIRQKKELTQSELGNRVGVQRQAVYDMESGRYLPNTSVALRLARVLDCRVEDLFEEEMPASCLPVRLIEPADADARIGVVRVRGRLVGYPLDWRFPMGDGFQAAGGLLGPEGKTVRLLQPESSLSETALLLGCDPAFPILSAHVARASGDARLHRLFASSHRALELLAAGSAHMAGTHLHNTGPEEANTVLARNALGRGGGLVIAFSLFEEGLMVAPGNPLGIRSVADMAGVEMRLVNREPGAALRVLLDDCLDRSGTPTHAVRGYDALVKSHAEGALRVTYGAADAALGLRAVAKVHGLDFIPMSSVRCDLVVPGDLRDHPVVKTALDVLQSKAFRTELAALPGYETSRTGDVIAEF